MHLLTCSKMTIYRDLRRSNGSVRICVNLLTRRSIGNICDFSGNCPRGESSYRIGCRWIDHSTLFTVAQARTNQMRESSERACNNYVYMVYYRLSTIYPVIANRPKAVNSLLNIAEAEIEPFVEEQIYAAAEGVGNLSKDTNKRNLFVRSCAESLHNPL